VSGPDRSNPIPAQWQQVSGVLRGLHDFHARRAVTNVRDRTARTRDWRTSPNSGPTP